MNTRLVQLLPHTRRRNPLKIPADAVVWAPELRPLVRIHRLVKDPAGQGHTACGLSTIGWVRLTGRQAVEQVAQTTCRTCWGAR